MEKIVVIVVGCLFFLNVNAQKSEVANPDKFMVSAIVVIGYPDVEDSCFIAASVRENLIGKKKISISNTGDTLFVSLFVQYQKAISAGGELLGRNGKCGEISLSIASKNGKAAATSRGFVGYSSGGSYYLNLRLISEEAALAFQFLQ